MKKIISFCFAAFLVCSMSFAQETSSTSNETTVKKSNCLSAEEAAEKMGMTVAEYKEYCKKKCANKEGTKADASSTSTAMFASLAPKGEKAQSCNIEECAAKMGMTVAEYKEYCKKKCSTKGETKAAMGASAMATFASIQGAGEEGADKEVASNIAECAEILGISLEECLKRIKSNCGGMGMAKTASASELASALMVSNKASTKPAKAKCVKSAKACKAKKIN